MEEYSLILDDTDVRPLPPHWEEFLPEDRGYAGTLIITYDGIMLIDDSLLKGMNVLAYALPSD